MYELIIGNQNYSSWSLRPWVLMKHLGIPFEQRKFAFQSPDWQKVREVSPTGRVPTLTDGATVVWDSLAIVEYLAEAHDHVWPNDKIARAWARSAAAEMHSGFSTLRNVCGMTVGVRVVLDEVSADLQHDLNRISALWTEGLKRFGGPFLAGGAFTAVDAFFCPVAFRVQTYGLKLEPEAMIYAERLLALSAMKEWYEAGIAETWRDPSHEDEPLKYGRVVDDVRALPHV
jgi:glutathione S-transferase